MVHIEQHVKVECSHAILPFIKQEIWKWARFHTDNKEKSWVWEIKKKVRLVIRKKERKKER